METKTMPAAAAGLRVDHERWRESLDALMDQILRRFARYDAARNAGAFLLGVLSALESKNCWTIAELSGHQSPDKLQHLLSRAAWDADDIRDDVRRYVTDAFADPQAILVVDETGDLKKGTKTVGVQRQYSGTAGRIENCQVAVYMTYTSTKGHALIDRSLYRPASWTDDRARCAQAGVPDSIEFATKPALAAAMITGALDAGVAAAWVAGDEVYGADPDLRTMLHDRRITRALHLLIDRSSYTNILTSSDVKKLGKIPAGGGWRMVGRARGKRNAQADKTGSRNKHHQPLRGYHFLHTAIDAHSRLAYSELLADERKETAAAFWTRANAWFFESGITVRKVLTDNGSCYRSHAFDDALGDVEHRRTRPYRPQTNGKVERFHRTLADEWAYAKLYRPRRRPLRRVPTMATHLQSPPRPHRTRRPTTRHPRTQPLSSVFGVIFIP